MNFVRNGKKRCGTCKQVKPVDAFSLTSAGRPRPNCKPCTALLQRRSAPLARNAVLLRALFIACESDTRDMGVLIEMAKTQLRQEQDARLRTNIL